MKRISRLLIVCLLLCGCAKSPPVQPLSLPTETVAPQGLYDTGSGLEISSSGAVKTYPLGSRSGKAILCYGEGILLFSEGEKTALTLFTGETLIPTASIYLDFSLEPEDCTIGASRLSFFDPAKRQTVVLNGALEDIAHIDAPADMTGKPRLSEDGQLLYYSTSTAIRVWDVDTNIHRILRETTPSPKTISGLYGNGTVVAYQQEDGITRFLSTQTGALLYEDDTTMNLVAPGPGYAAALWETNLWSLVFSLDGVTKQALTPRELSAEYYLPDSQRAVTAACSGEVVTLDHYDLVSGHRTATQMYRGAPPKSMDTQGEGLWGLSYLAEYGGDAIFYWDTSCIQVQDNRIYTGPHYTAQSPDIQGLQQCQERASQIGCPYGLEILLWQEALQATPKALSVQPEYRVNILNRELELLDQWLAQFPEGMLKTTAGNFSSFRLCLLSQVEGGSQQWISGNQVTILLSLGDTSEQNLYHELFHGMETHILSHSNAFDQWNTLNPQGFRYDYDYGTNAIRDSGIYLTEENRSFIDTFSMSFPKEDRARVFEYAMLPDQGHLFQSKAMQKKLSAICQGLRDAYGLDPDGIYPWEQYLR